MKKALFVATITGHINYFHLPYLQMLKENSYKVFVASGDDKKVVNFCDEKYKISIKRAPYNFKNIIAIKQLRNIINKEKFDIIHCHTPMGATITRIAAKKARKKYGTRVIYTAHGFHFYKGAPKKNWLIFYPIEKYLSKYTDTLITINKEDYELARTHFNKRCKDIQYVPGVGIDTSKFNIALSNKEKIKIKNSIGLKENDFVLACVARMDKNKNQIFLIECMKEIIKKNNTMHLLLIGPDELNGYYQSQAKYYNIEKNIHFLGKRDDISRILQIVNIVVSASKREGLPVNIMEALASNIPVVALNCRGMQDLITNGKNGYIVSTKEEFIDKIFLIKDKNTLKEVKLDQKFAISSVEKQMREIYKI